MPFIASELLNIFGSSCFWHHLCRKVHSFTNFIPTFSAISYIWLQLLLASFVLKGTLIYQFHSHLLQLFPIFGSSCFWHHLCRKVHSFTNFIPTFCSYFLYSAPVAFGIICAERYTHLPISFPLFAAISYIRLQLLLASFVLKGTLIYQFHSHLLQLFPIFGSSCFWHHLCRKVHSFTNFIPTFCSYFIYSAPVAFGIICAERYTHLPISFPPFAAISYIRLQLLLASFVPKGTLIYQFHSHLLQLFHIFGSSCFWHHLCRKVHSFTNFIPTFCSYFIYLAPVAFGIICAKRYTHLPISFPPFAAISYIRLQLLLASFVPKGTLIYQFHSHFLQLFHIFGSSCFWHYLCRKVHSFTNFIPTFCSYFIYSAPVAFGIICAKRYTHLPISFPPFAVSSWCNG